ncbi:hybrid sensor histidine kinase/response regulator [Chitinophaga lutea]
MKISATLKKFIAALLYAGTAGVDDETRRRVKMVNTISLSICALLITIIPVCMVITPHKKILIPALIDLGITMSVMYLNHRRRYAAAALSIYLVQCVSIVYFGLLLSNVVALEAMIIFLIAIIFLIFKEAYFRKLCLAIAMVALAAMELCNYLKVVEPIPMSEDGNFLLHTLIIWGVLMLILVVSRPYIRSNDELVKANYFKRMFLYQITHEIRTPLNAIYGAAQLLRREIKLDENLEAIKPLVDQQLEAIRNTRNIINNVLDMAKIESGQIENNEKESFMPEHFFSKIIEVNRIMARPRQLRVKLEIDGMPEVIYDDLLKVHQVVTNLLANAIKYADKGTTVLVKVTGKNDRWVIQVTNYGTPITQEKKELIFDPFVTDKSKYTEGTGLGLYIVKGKVESLGGTIDLTSNADGCTTFTVELPLAEGSLRDMHAEEEELSSFDTLDNIHVLIAEDNELNGALLCNLLRKMGCQTTVVSNGREVVQHMERQAPDIVIMDYHMEVMDGRETLEYLKASPALRHIPVIISSGDSFTETKASLMKAGADAFIEKPVNYKSLLKLLGMHLNYNRQAFLQ